MNDWERIRAFYRANQAEIMKAGAGNWGIDPYAWDFEAGISMTPIEFALWSDIRALSAIFYPQYPVGRRFVDFGNPCAKVAIECDGAAFHTDRAADQQRQAEIESYGWTVYRFTGRECFIDSHEYEDENGVIRYAVGDTYLRLKEVVMRHGLEQKRGGSGRILPASDFLAGLLQEKSE